MLWACRLPVHPGNRVPVGSGQRSLFRTVPLRGMRERAERPGTQPCPASAGVSRETPRIWLLLGPPNRLLLVMGSRRKADPPSLGSLTPGLSLDDGSVAGSHSPLAIGGSLSFTVRAGGLTADGKLQGAELLRRDHDV